LDLEWDAIHVRRMIDRYEGFLTADQWPNWVLGSHDNQRVAGALGQERARVAAMMQLTLRGTPILYYGEEIGMQNVDITPGQERDQLALRMPGRGKGRDYQRTPMQWSGEANAGFTTGVPWLPVAKDFGRVNVQRQREDSRSMLQLYRRLLALRMSHEALRIGHYLPDVLDERALVYVRQAADKRVLVALNFTEESIEISPRAGGGRLLFSSHLDREADRMGLKLPLRANEGIVIELDQGA
jgi:alpha-glucosidase